MSPALLAMSLSMFGEDDITVSNYDDFEHHNNYLSIQLLLPRGLFKYVRGSEKSLTLVDPCTDLVLVNAPRAAGPLS